MTFEQITAMLDAHGIYWHTVLGKIMASEYWLPSTGDFFFTDVTGYTNKQMLNFLGY